MDLRKCSKIRDIVRLQQVLKKWRKQASSSSSSSSNKCNNSSSSNNKGMRFLKKTLSFSESSNIVPNTTTPSDQVVPRGFLAVVCIGRSNEMKRFVIPMQYLNHSIFVMLLREAEEEFGFQNEGVLRIPCEVSMFENILQFMEEEENYDSSAIPACHTSNYSSSSPDSDLSNYQHYSQMCR